MPRLAAERGRMLAPVDPGGLGSAVLSGKMQAAAAYLCVAAAQRTGFVAAAPAPETLENNMATDQNTTCEEFYFNRIAPVEATSQDYREFFELLWEVHSEGLYKYAYSWLKNFEDARDVCADAYVRAMQYVQEHSDRVPLKVNFRAWLRVICRHLILDRFRRAMIAPERVSSKLVAAAPVEQAPEERLVISEDLELLHKCIQSLTDRARTIVTLRDLNGMSEKDVAKEVGSNPNAVGVALHRARKCLRECVNTGQLGQ